MQCDRLMLMVGLSFLTLSRWLTTDYRRFMIIPMLCVTIFVILVVWFLLPRVARLMIHTPTAISIFVCLSMVQLMAVFISMRCTLCGHFLQVALTLILDRKSGSAGMPRPISYAVFCLKKKKKKKTESHNKKIKNRYRVTYALNEQCHRIQAMLYKK